MLVGRVAVAVMVVPVAVVVMRNTPAVMIVVVPRLRLDRRVVVIMAVLVLVAMVMAVLVLVLVLVAMVVAMVVAVLVAMVVAMLVAVVMSVRVLRPRGARRSARPARASVEGLSRGRRRTRRTMGDRVLGHRAPMLPAGPS